MKKVKIKIAILGHIPHSINLEKIQTWKSELFDIINPFSVLNIVGDSDGTNWEYSDENMEDQLPIRGEEDILLAITYVPLEMSYFLRRFTNNRVCMTYNEMTEILKSDNIPLENLILRIVYAISLVYKSHGDKIPESAEPTNYAHDETRGCLFDMNGIKTDIIYSLDKPKICDSCVQNLTNIPKYKLEKNIISQVQKELKNIEKKLYYRMTDFFKSNPILAIILSSILAIFLGFIGSSLGRIFWENCLKHWI